MEKSIYSKLKNIQIELKAEKTEYNRFSDFYYRTLSDILENLKPLLEKYNCVLNLSDKLEYVGDRYYIKAIAKLIDAETGDEIESVGYAREDEEKKKFDVAQLTGSASTYARKYALNGLLIIDDSLEIDSLSNEENVPKSQNTSNQRKNKGVQNQNYSQNQGNNTKNYNQQPQVQGQNPTLDEIIQEINETARELSKNGKKDELKQAIVEVIGRVNYSTVTDPAEAMQVLNNIKKL